MSSEQTAETVALDLGDLDPFCKALVEAMHAAGDRAGAANGVHPETVRRALINTPRSHGRPSLAVVERVRRLNPPEGADMATWHALHQTVLSVLKPSSSPAGGESNG